MFCFLLVIRLFVFLASPKPFRRRKPFFFFTFILPSCLPSALTQQCALGRACSPRVLFPALLSIYNLFFFFSVFFFYLRVIQQHFKSTAHRVRFLFILFSSSSSLTSCLCPFFSVFIFFFLFLSSAVNASPSKDEP